jgi:disulfide bond formation protein DsbB
MDISSIIHFALILSTCPTLISLFLLGTPVQDWIMENFLRYNDVELSTSLFVNIEFLSIQIIHWISFLLLSIILVLLFFMFFLKPQKSVTTKGFTNHGIGRIRCTDGTQS